MTVSTSFLLTVCALFLFSVFEAAAQQKKADSVVVTYEGQVQRILSSTCYSCHGDDEPMGKLFVDTYEDIMRGGEHGPTVVPGKPDSSHLYLKLLSEPPFGKQMPARRGRQMSQRDIDTIRLWILQGALRARDTIPNTPVD